MPLVPIAENASLRLTAAHSTRGSWHLLLIASVALQVLSDKKIGVVAHFYMDPEVQGVLSQAAERWHHINISDSLAMADRAVKMAEEGCKAIAVLGVDFMSENVRAILDEAGHRNVEVCIILSLNKQ